MYSYCHWVVSGIATVQYPVLPLYSIRYYHCVVSSIATAQLQEFYSLLNKNSFCIFEYKTGADFDANGCKIKWFNAPSPGDVSNFLPIPEVFDNMKNFNCSILRSIKKLSSIEEAKFFYIKFSKQMTHKFQFRSQ